MRLVRYATTSGSARAGIVEDGVVYDAGESILDVTLGERVAPLAEVTLLAPLVGPRKIICVGLNYRDHAEEAGLGLPDEPPLFPKFDNAIIGPGDPILLPPYSSEVDYEAELGVIIGTRASNVSEADALDHVLGYTCLHDVSSRDLQFAPDQKGQWLWGKAQDSYCPIGPVVVTTDEIPDPQALEIRCVLNGETVQKSSTSEMVRGVAELIAWISRGIVLEPGDILATGTPAGVGFIKKPPVFLKDGDVVRVEIDGIGVLENPVVTRG